MSTRLVPRRCRLMYEQSLHLLYGTRDSPGCWRVGLFSRTGNAHMHDVDGCRKESRMVLANA